MWNRHNGDGKPEEPRERLLQQLAVRQQLKLFFVLIADDFGVEEIKEFVAFVGIWPVTIEQPDLQISIPIQRKTQGQGEQLIRIKSLQKQDLRFRVDGIKCVKKTGD